MAIETPFPGRAVRSGDDRRDVVILLQTRLENAGCAPGAVDGVFGAATRSAVQTFQSHRGLVVDGTVGAATWKALFGDNGTAPGTAPPGRFAAELLKVASAEVGVRESGGPNRGPRVDEYLRNVGIDPTRGSYSWCAAFVYYCFTRAATVLGVKNPCLKTAGCMNHWHRAPDWARIPVTDVLGAPDVVHPGAVFVVDHGEGKGHTGLVERITQDSVHTLEGNTNAGGSREGDGVYRRIRPLAKINAGFIDYSLSGNA